MNYLFVILFFFSVLLGSLSGIYLGFLLLSNNRKKTQHKTNKTNHKKNTKKQKNTEKSVINSDEKNIEHKKQNKKEKSPLVKVKEKSETVTHIDDEYGINFFSKKNAIKSKMEKQDKAYNSVKKKKK